METINSLANQIIPSSTVLFLGAGASIPSGGPSGYDLAKYLCDSLANGDKISDDLIEVASILEDRLGRRPVISKIRERLRDLEPTGGLLAIPKFEWKEIFTTNFDRLLEKSYKKSGKTLNVVKSNYDFSQHIASSDCTLFKIHGCITQDTSDGHKAGLVLTETDYDNYSKYRQALFGRINQNLISRDVLFIGYSLKDQHLRNSVLEALRINENQGASGRVFVLVFERDDDRARLLERKGVRVCFGSIDEFLDALCGYISEAPINSAVDTENSQLPVRLLSSTLQVSHACMRVPNLPQLFNGAPASYADIRAGFTFERSIERRVTDVIKSGKRRIATIIGAAGVGKTTLSRRIAYTLYQDGIPCWEHRSDFQFRPEDWIEVDHLLKEQSKRGVLVIDECANHLRQLNKLADIIASEESFGLSLIVTSGASVWNSRVKSPTFFSHGMVEKLDVLDNQEVNLLVNLVANDEVGKLVDLQFKNLSRSDKINHLRNRCSSDMFVCMKNIFAFDSLDEILLREYATLSEEYQEIYRHISAMEASGAKVHRQLVIRTLGVNTTTVSAILSGLEDVVREYDIDPSDGVFGWATRHLVIARIITKYKLFNQDELYDLLNRVIDNLNPAYPIEVRSISGICSSEFGIGRLLDDKKKITLFKKLIEIAPAQRAPRHKLINTYIKMGQLELADLAIQDAEQASGPDGILSRQKIQVVLKRAETSDGIMESDRVALVHQAITLSIRCVEKYKDDKHAYSSYAEAALELGRRTNDFSKLNDAIERMGEAVNRLLDPDLAQTLNDFERARQRFSVA